MKKFGLLAISLLYGLLCTSEAPAKVVALSKCVVKCNKTKCEKIEGRPKDCSQWCKGAVAPSKAYKALQLCQAGVAQKAIIVTLPKPKPIKVEEVPFIEPKKGVVKLIPLVIPEHLALPKVVPLQILPIVELTPQQQADLRKVRITVLAAAVKNVQAILSKLPKRAAFFAKQIDPAAQKQLDNAVKRAITESTSLVNVSKDKPKSLLPEFQSLSRTIMEVLPLITEDVKGNEALRQASINVGSAVQNLLLIGVGKSSAAGTERIRKRVEELIERQKQEHPKPKK